MKVRIVDPGGLRAIAPSALISYVMSEGWEKSEPFGKHADIYIGEERPELIIPRDNLLSDYPSVVSRLISILFEVLDQDELAIYRSLIGANHDLVRIRALGANEDGTIPLDNGITLVSNARDMLLAAACSTKNPQPLYRAGANREASEYIDNIRLGQTKHGSFIVTLLSPVAPTLQSSFADKWGDFDDDPIERQVTRRLVQALTSARNAVELAHQGRGEEAFEQAVSEGVSANLCEALERLITAANQLEVSVRWARTRPAPNVRTRVSFTTAHAQVLRESARSYRAKEPRQDVSLYGVVHKLSRNFEEDYGNVTIKSEIYGKMQSINVILDHRNYNRSIHAHKNKDVINATGDLDRFWNRCKLINSVVRILKTGEDNHL
jgi:hypothetical protein